MLRRPATTIKLTPEDILEYDDQMKEEAAKKEKQDHENAGNILQEHVDKQGLELRYDALSMAPEKVKNKDERIGVLKRN